MNMILYFCLLCNTLNSQVFKDYSHILGNEYNHTYLQVIDEMPLRVSGGVSSADVNNDGYYDLLFVLGDTKSMTLLINIKGQYFEDKSTEYRLENYSFRASSPHFFNLDNDEFIDFVIGSVDGTPPKVFKNINGKSFAEIKNESFESLKGKNTINISSVDFNNDGLQDLFFTHWLENFNNDHFWENKGNGSFMSMDSKLDFYNPHKDLDYIHTANFLDINKDGYSDLLLSSDFGTSQVWLNRYGIRFIHQKQYQLDDENGMGSTIADFDNDGHYDWFVTSVFDDDGVLEGNWGGSGNKLYKGTNSEVFKEEAKNFGLENASWGWATTFADINNDGYQDLIVVNGWPQGSKQFKNDKLKVFISDKGTYFNDYSEQYGISDTLQGRGVTCVDIDNNGLLDIIISNYRGPVKLYKNFINNNYHYVKFNLWESKSNPFGFGSEIELFSNSKKQKQRVSNASNYVSQNPNQIHFGLGELEVIDSVYITWSDKSISKYYNLKSNIIHTISKPNVDETKSLNSSIYPNPAENYISVKLNFDLPHDSKIRIINDRAELVSENLNYFIHNNATFVEKYDISFLSKGIYFVVCTLNGDIIKSLPFIKI
jgi:hypothetical protein